MLDFLKKPKEPSPPSTTQYIKLEPGQLTQLHDDLKKILLPFLKESNLRLLDNHKQQIQTENKKQLTTEVDTMREDFSQVIDQITDRVNQLIALVEEMLSGKGQPNQEIILLAERVAALEEDNKVFKNLLMRSQNSNTSLNPYSQK